MAGAPANADSEGPAAEEVDSLVQHKHHNHHHKYARDSYDHDPTTTSMYDDGHVYTDKPGNVNWKFAGGPKAELDAAIAAKQAKAAPAPPALMQKSAKDSYDHDPTTTSMYDDGHVYTDKPGNVNWKFAGGPKAELDAAQAAKKAASCSSYSSSYAKIC